MNNGVLILKGASSQLDLASMQGAEARENSAFVKQRRQIMLSLMKSQLF